MARGCAKGKFELRRLMTLPWSPFWDLRFAHQVITGQGKHDTGTFHPRAEDPFTTIAGSMKAWHSAIEFVRPPVLFLQYQTGSRSRAGAAGTGSV
jgi:hypothetical protein